MQVRQRVGLLSACAGPGRADSPEMGVILPLSIPEYNFSLGGLDRADHTPCCSVTSPCQLLSVISLRMNKQSFMIVLPSCAHDHPSFELRNDSSMSDS